MGAKTQQALTPDVVWMRGEWEKKENILQQTFGDAVDPATYNDGLFHGDSSAARVVVWTKAEKGQCIHKYYNTADMLADCVKRRDAAVAPCFFFKDIRNKATLRQLHALTVDLDGVAYADVAALIQHGFMDLMPTYVVNSGRGLHLVYWFDPPVECYDWSKKILDRMLKKLKQRFDSIWLSYEVDQKPSIVQIYRLVGSRTRLGTVCTAYRAGQPYTVEGLATALGITWAKPQPRPQRTGWIHDHDNILTMPNGRASFYTCVRDGIIANTTRGHRHLALFALGVVAAKCRVSQDVLQADARKAQRVFNQRDPHDRIPDKDVAKALASVDPRKAKTVKAATLERWLGWSFERKTKRNGRSRAEHLEQVAHVASAAARSGRARDAVATYVAAHPDATVTATAAALGMSRTTVTKYMKEMKEAAAKDAAFFSHFVEVVSAQPQTQAGTSTPTPAPQPPVTPGRPTGTDADAVQHQRDLATLVTTIMDPAIDGRTRARLLAMLPPTHRKIVAGWLPDN